jgi:hypothetical protein
MGKASRKKGNKLERALENVDAIVLVHPAFDLRDLGAYNKSPESYVEGLRQMNAAAQKQGKPIYAIPYTSNHLTLLPPEIIEPWSILNPRMYDMMPNQGLQTLSKELNREITQLTIALGGIYETACVAGWGQTCFQRYEGRHIREEFKEKIELVRPMIPLKGLSAKVIHTITRDKV